MSAGGFVPKTNPRLRSVQILLNDVAKSSVVLDREVEKEKRDEPLNPRIRCPLCGWSPRKEDLWSCTCGNEWNTFDTGGRKKCLRLSPLVQAGWADGHQSLISLCIPLRMPRCSLWRFILSPKISKKRMPMPEGRRTRSSS